MYFVTLHSIACLEDSDPENTNLGPRKLRAQTSVENAFADKKFTERMHIRART